MCLRVLTQLLPILVCVTVLLWIICTPPFVRVYTELNYLETMDKKHMSYMLDLYTAHRKVIRRLFRIPGRTHNSIDLVSRHNCRIDKLILKMVNQDNDTMRSITQIFVIQTFLVCLLLWGVQRVNTCWCSAPFKSTNSLVFHSYWILHLVP